MEKYSASGFGVTWDFLRLLVYFQFFTVHKLNHLLMKISTSVAPFIHSTGVQNEARQWNKIHECVLRLSL